MTIYELREQYKEVLDMAENPDIDPQAIADTLEMIGDEIEIKAESSAVILQELGADVEKIRAEEKRLSERRAKLENNIKIIKERLYDTMILTGKTKFKTALFSFGIQKNPAKLVVDDESLIPEEYYIPQPAKLDSKKLKEAIKAGEDISYAHLEQGESLRIR